jgi:hypothetical protein
LFRLNSFSTFVLRFFREDLFVLLFGLFLENIALTSLLDIHSFSHSSFEEVGGEELHELHGQQIERLAETSDQSEVL